MEDAKVQRGAQGRKHNSSFNNRSFYFYAVSLCKSSEICTALSVRAISSVLTAFYSPRLCRPRARLCRWRGCIQKKSLFLFYVADKKELLTACGKVRTQRAVPVLAKHFDLEERQASITPVAKKNPSCTPEEFRRLCVRCTKKLSRVSRGRASTSPSQQKQRPALYIATNLLKPCRSLRAQISWSRLSLAEQRANE